jgi:hypothetical protein
MSEFPSISFLNAIERNMSGGFTPEEQLAEGRRIASNPRAVDGTARKLDDLYETLLSGDYLEDLISAAELGLADADAIAINPRSVPETGGARNVAQATNRGQIDKKQKEVDRMQNLFDVLSKIKSGSQEEAPPSQEVVEKPKKVAKKVAKTAPKEPSGGFGDILDEIREGVKSGMEAEKASNEGMAGALKAEAARQASNEGMAGALKAEAARQAEVSAKAKEPVTRGDLDPDMQDMMGTTGVDPDDYDLAGGAEEPEADYTQQAVDLFKTVHATDYDPKSSMDKGKLEKMKSMLAKQGGLGDMSANQFALQVYRNS